MKEAAYSLYPVVYLLRPVMPDNIIKSQKCYLLIVKYFTNYLTYR